MTSIVCSTLNSMVCENVDFHGVFDNVEGLVKACDILQLDTLKTACENVMIKQVEPPNVVGFY